MKHKIQNEDKQNTMQHSKLKGQSSVDDLETQAIWSIRYRKKTNKTLYNKVTVEGTIKSGRPRDTGNMEHKIQNEDKQNTIQQSNRWKDNRE